MADDKHYVGGDYYQLDDLSGFKIRAKRSVKIPGGQTGNLIVAPSRWETQQPQDFVRGIPDDQTVPQARPRQPNQFTIVGTWVTEPADRLSYYITVASTVGFAIGQVVQIMLDNGDPFYPTVVEVTGFQLRISPVLPHGVGGGNSGNNTFADPLENTVIVYRPTSPQLPFLTDDYGHPITDDLGDLWATP